METKLFDLFNFIGTHELLIERQRELLAKCGKFETYSCFKRVARAGGPHKVAAPAMTPDVPLSDIITNLDIYMFLR